MWMRFKPKMVKAMRVGSKTYTLRENPHKEGIYDVVENGVVTDIKIRIFRVWEVTDISTYIIENYAKEGFSSPAEMVDFFIEELGITKMPSKMWAHEFEVVAGLNPLLVQPVQEEMTGQEDYLHDEAMMEAERLREESEQAKAEQDQHLGEAEEEAKAKYEEEQRQREEAGQ